MENSVPAGTVYRINVYCDECLVQRAISFQVANTCELHDVDEMVDEVTEDCLNCDCHEVGHFTDMFVYPLGRVGHNGH